MIILFTRILPAYLFFLITINKKTKLNTTKKIIYTSLIFAILSGGLDFRYLGYICSFGAFMILLNTDLRNKSYNDKTNVITKI